MVAHHCHVVHKYSLNEMGQVLHGTTPGVMSLATNHEGTPLFTQANT